MVPQPLFNVFFSPQYAHLPVTPVTRSVVPCFRGGLHACLAVRLRWGRSSRSGGAQELCAPADGRIWLGYRDTHENMILIY